MVTRCVAVLFLFLSSKIYAVHFDRIYKLEDGYFLALVGDLDPDFPRELFLGRTQFGDVKPWEKIYSMRMDPTGPASESARVVTGRNTKFSEIEYSYEMLYGIGEGGQPLMAEVREKVGRIYAKGAQQPIKKIPRNIKVTCKGNSACGTSSQALVEEIENALENSTIKIVVTKNSVKKTDIFQVVDRLNQYLIVEEDVLMAGISAVKVFYSVDGNLTQKTITGRSHVFDNLKLNPGTKMRDPRKFKIIYKFSDNSVFEYMPVTEELNADPEIAVMPFFANVILQPYNPRIKTPSTLLRRLTSEEKMHFIAEHPTYEKNPSVQLPVVNQLCEALFLN